MSSSVSNPAIAYEPSISSVARVLTIAGSDSGGGAGIQADLKTFTCLRSHGMSVITALTAQNTLGVQNVLPVDPSFVRDQFVSVMSDIGASAIKTGMLSSIEIVHTVADLVQEYQVKNLVVDPVMVSTTGNRLLDKNAEEAMKIRLIPQALLVTPNVPEAEALTGIQITDMNQMKEAATKLFQLGCRHVLIKGGHFHLLESDSGKKVVDLLYDGQEFTIFPHDYVDTKNTHGTGCTLAAAITVFIAKGSTVRNAIEQSQKYLDGALKSSVSIGKGIGCLHHSYLLDYMCDRDNILHQSPLIHRLISSCQKDWNDYMFHPFVKGIQDGTLPLESFKYYIRQDYLFS